MKKFLAGLVTAIVLQSACYGAVSDDIYVRRDVFDAKMDLLFERLDKAVVEIKGEVKTLSERVDSLEKSLNERINGVEKSLNEKIDGVEKRLNEKIDGVEKRLDERIDGVEKRLDDKISGVERRIDDVDWKINFMSNFLYYILVLLGALLLLPSVSRWFENREARKENRNNAVNFTLDDVRRLIAEEINAKIPTKPQAS